MFFWRAAFGHVGSAYQRTMIRGVFGVVKGGFAGICRWTQEGAAGMGERKGARTQ